MLKSMTGFGRCEIADKDRKVIVEMKSVNHRYCDITIKMPKKLSFFESAIRSLLKKYIQRGKVDIFITYEDYTENRSCLKYNRELAAEYMDALRQMSEDFSIENDVRTSALSRYPEVLTVEEQTVDEDELWHFLEPAITKACEGLVERSPQIIADYRARLEDKVRDLLGDTNIDEGRIAMETTIYADKLCVDEEIVRLKSHIEATRTTLVNGGSVGRKLDFIAQEMNREANTILSKANDLLISNTAIDLKTDIEKVREQIQNIE